MKKKTPNEIVIEMFGGSKTLNPFFSSLSLEAYKGYVTAMVLRDNPKEGLRAEEWFDIVGIELNKGAL